MIVNLCSHFSGRWWDPDAADRRELDRFCPLWAAAAGLSPQSKDKRAADRVSRWLCDVLWFTYDPRIHSCVCDNRNIKSSLTMSELSVWRWMDWTHYFLHANSIHSLLKGLDVFCSVQWVLFTPHMNIWSFQLYFLFTRLTEYAPPTRCLFLMMSQIFKYLLSTWEKFANKIKLQDSDQELILAFRTCVH